MPETASELAEFARNANAWPFEEAKKLVARVERTGQKQVLFETGYGPSGLPHIGTFGEVARTTMVRHAFVTLTEGRIATRLLAFSDDLDGLRKVPDNIPNKELVAAHLGKPLTQVPDPFGEYASFGEHNNARLRAFLDAFGFEYEFASATRYYQSGRFDATLLKMLARYETVQNIMLPSLRAERAASYAPFLPLHPRTGVVMQVPLEEIDAARGLVAWRDPETGERFETPVTGGHCKLQWKPDWAMRWCALGVDYEMAGKDLIDSVKLSGEIARALDCAPPEGFNYELFLDENGQKISKSRGNGLTIDEWLRYASPESLAFFMYWKPREAKKLYFDVIPKAVDEYLAFLDAYPRQDWKLRLGNPAWHIHSGEPPAPEFIAHEGEVKGTAISFAMLLNLAAVANSEDPAVLWGFLRRYAPGAKSGKIPPARPHDPICGGLFPRFRAAQKSFPRGGRRGARRAGKTFPGAGRPAAQSERGRGPDPALRRGPPDPALPEFFGERGDAGKAGRVERLVLHALSGAARRAARPALRLLHRALWRGQRPRLDRRRSFREVLGAGGGVSRAGDMGRLGPGEGPARPFP